jgi:beta-galactosidase
MQLAYTVLGHGRVKVELTWNGNANLPDLEAFGLSFRLPVEMSHVDYYGFGPLENYSDRKHGAKLGRFQYEAADNVTPYLQPQECGSREGVREITVTDDFGSGLRVEMVDQPLAVSVLPYSVYELMNARHQDELADPNYTYLDVALCRKGIGGDDSWQAPVHPEFHLPAGEPRKLTFILSVIK